VLLAAGCVTEQYEVILPAPGASTPLSIDGKLRMQDLDDLSPACVTFVGGVGQVGSYQHLALLIPGGDADVAAESLTFAQALREAGYFVRRTNRRKLEPKETLVEIFPITDGALQIDDGRVRAWRVEVDVRLYTKSDEPAYATQRLVAERAAPIPRP
jgi:hypothetical protein